MESKYFDAAKLIAKIDETVKDQLHDSKRGWISTGVCLGLIDGHAVKLVVTRDEDDLCGIDLKNPKITEHFCVKSPKEAA